MEAFDEIAGDRAGLAVADGAGVDAISIEMPSDLYIVAAISAGVVGRSLGIAPISSEEPTACPPLMPPPAIRTVQQAGRFTVLRIFHPAAAIYDRTKRDALFSDFERLGDIID